MQIPASIAAEAALTKQNVAFSAIKHNADQAQAVANILEEASRSAPVNPSKGSSVNTKA